MTDSPLTSPRVLDPTSQPINYADFSLDQLGATHFIGIGGAGMSVLAEILLKRGVPVSGSDRQASAKTDRLQALGATIYLDQKGQNLQGAQTVVWSSAIKPDNPEIQEASRRGLRILHRSDILALLMAHSRSVTVAGAHGKTTTSAMIAQILQSASSGDLHDPSFAIGGSIRTDQGTVDGGHAGGGTVFVAEADESDGSFEKYHPSIAVITNVEPDHLDYYGSAAAFQQAFVDHAHHALDHVILCGDDPGALAVLKSLNQEALHHAVVYTTQEDFSLAGLPATLVRIEQEETAEAQVESGQQDQAAESFSLLLPASLLAQSEGGPSQDVLPGRYPVKLRVPGLHNARNAAAAIICSILLGMNPHQACQAAYTFYGAKRRFEIRGVERAVTVVDDYAHHPTEIVALLKAARRRFPQSKIRVIFQPHLYSRTFYFAQQFADALSLADDVMVTGIFPAREKQEDWPQVSADTIVSLMKKENGPEFSASIDDMNQAGRLMASHCGPGDVVITVGAGSITTVADVVLSELKKQAM